MAKDSGRALSKSQIADHLAKSAGQSKRTAIQFLDDLTALAYREAKNSFTIPGVGKLVLANRKARMGRNPATGEEIKIPSKRVVKFRVSSRARRAILDRHGETAVGMMHHTRGDALLLKLAALYSRR